MRITSRYLRFRAEHVTTTPSCGLVVEDLEGERRDAAASRKAMSQSHRSASVRGVPWDIFCLLESVWY